MSLHGLLQGQLYYLYIDDVRTSQEAHASTACYGESFAFFYVDDVRTSQEAQAFGAQCLFQQRTYGRRDIGARIHGAATRAQGTVSVNDIRPSVYLKSGVPVCFNLAVNRRITLKYKTAACIPIGGEGEGVQSMV
jgi:hypothetical protein